MILRAYKYRLYPTKQQAEYLNRNFGATRFVWNELVANFNAYGSDAHVPKLTEKKIKADNPWLKNCISYAVQKKRRDFDEFTRQYFNKKRKSKLGRPKFKKRGISRDSFHVPGQAIRFMKAFDFIKGTVKIPKLDPIKVIFDRFFYW